MILSRATDIALACGVVALWGCTSILGIDEDYVRGDPFGGTSTATTGGGPVGGAGAVGGVGNSATGGAPGGGGAGGELVGGTGGVPFTCPSGPGPTMVDVGGYCIDRTEVTKADYLVFLNAAVPLQSVTMDPLYCGWNNSYLPTGAWAPPADATHPVTFVDWCDAFAYCTWAGKRLCGAIGGGPTPFAQFTDPLVSQWHRVCSNGGTTTHGYGNGYVASTCNEADAIGNTTPVGSFDTCHGTIAPFDAIFDIAGNAREWEDACNAEVGAGDTCTTRGSSFQTNNDVATCSHLSPSPDTRSAKGNHIGFRCCGP